MKETIITTLTWKLFEEAPKDGTVVLGSNGMFFKWHTRYDCLQYKKSDFTEGSVAFIGYLTGWFDCGIEGDCEETGAEGSYLHYRFDPSQLPLYWTILTLPVYDSLNENLASNVGSNNK